MIGDLLPATVKIVRHEQDEINVTVLYLSRPVPVALTLQTPAHRSLL
jgi:transcription antitermination factor NusG